jgi:hypothetical protein
MSCGVPRGLIRLAPGARAKLQLMAMEGMQSSEEAAFVNGVASSGNADGNQDGVVSRYAPQLVLAKGVSAPFPVCFAKANRLHPPRLWKCCSGT